MFIYCQENIKDNNKSNNIIIKKEILSLKNILLIMMCIIIFLACFLNILVPPAIIFGFAAGYLYNNLN